MNLEEKLQAYTKYKLLAEFRNDEESWWVVSLIRADVENEFKQPIEVLVGQKLQ